LPPVREQDPRGHLRLSPRGDPDEPDDAGVLLLAHDDELTEVPVERDQHSTLFQSPSQDLLVTLVLLPRAGPHHVVTGLFEDRARAAPHAGVEENPHGSPSLGSGSTRSWATRRRA